MCVFAHLCSLGTNKITMRGKKIQKTLSGKNVPNAGPYSLPNTFFLFFFLIICRSCTRKQSFGYFCSELEMHVLVEVLVRD
jgi:hypothetical protein